MGQYILGLSKDLRESWGRICDIFDVGFELEDLLREQVISR